MDFPVTRALLDRLPEWVAIFNAALPAPRQVPTHKGGLSWVHDTKSGHVVQLAKAVRIASGLRAAMILADAAHTVESGTLLRSISDYASEIIFLGEGQAEGRYTTDQARFIEQSFSSLPVDPDALASQEHKAYVGRKALANAEARLFDRSGGDKELHAKLTRYLNLGYDGYVHGTYPTAMELYTGEGGRFMLSGSDSARHRCVAKSGVAGKLGFALQAYRFMAITWQLHEAAKSLVVAYDSLAASNEESHLHCPPV